MLSSSRVFGSHNPYWKLVKAVVYIDFLLCIIVSRRDCVGRVMYQGGCIFSFPGSISGFKVHFNDMEPCVVLAATAAAAPALLEYPMTNCQWVQVQSEDLFLFPAFPSAFLGQAHGESSRKSCFLKL